MPGSAALWPNGCGQGRGRSLVGYPTASAEGAGGAQQAAQRLRPRSVEVRSRLLNSAGYPAQMHLFPDFWSEYNCFVTCFCLRIFIHLRIPQCYVFQRGNRHRPRPQPLGSLPGTSRDIGRSQPLGSLPPLVTSAAAIGQHTAHPHDLGGSRCHRTPYVTYHISYLTHHVAYVIYHVSYVIYHT